MTMRKVHLYGRLAKYGGPFDLNVSTAAEAVHALDCQIRGFGREFDDGYFQVIKGDLRTGMELDLQTCAFKFRNGDFHIVPVPRGRGSGKGIGKIIVGVAIMAIAVASAVITAGGSLTAAALAAPAILGVSFQQVAIFGLMVTLGGVASLMARAPDVKGYGDRNTPDQRPSFMFNTPVNVTEQGGPVPLVYGRFRVGSVVVSAGLTAEQIAA